MYTDCPRHYQTKSKSWKYISIVCLTGKKQVNQFKDQNVSICNCRVRNCTEKTIQNLARYVCFPIIFNRSKWTATSKYCTTLQNANRGFTRYPRFPIIRTNLQSRLSWQFVEDGIDIAQEVYLPHSRCMPVQQCIRIVKLGLRGQELWVSALHIKWALGFILNSMLIDNLHARDFRIYVDSIPCWMRPWPQQLLA